MAIVKAYCSDKSGFVEIDTDDFIFDNTITNGSFWADETLYPYVKIDGQYYINSGEYWTVNNSNRSARMMYIKDAFLDKTSTPLQAALLKLTSKEEIEGEQAEHDKNPAFVSLYPNRLHTFQENLKRSAAGVVTVENYRGQGKYITGLSFTGSSIKDYAPYKNSDGLVVFNSSPYYWDMCPTSREYFLLSNFNDTMGTSDSYSLEVKSDGYLYIHKKGVYDGIEKINRIKKEWVPYLILCSKGVNSYTTSMPVYSTALISNGWKWLVGTPNSFIFTLDWTGYPSGLSMHMTGNLAPDNLVWINNPATININLEQFLLSTKIQMYTGTKIVIDSENVTINNKTYDWNNRDLFSDNGDVKQQFVTEKYSVNDENTYFHLSTNQSIEEGYYEDEKFIATEMGNSAYNEANVFFGYKINFKGSNYQINEKTTPIFDIEENVKYKRKFWNTSNDIIIDSYNIKNKVQEGEKWDSAAINLIDWTNKVSTKCGMLPKFVSLLNTSLASSTDHDTNLNGAEPQGSYCRITNVEFDEDSSLDGQYWTVKTDQVKQRWPRDDLRYMSIGLARIGFTSDGEYGWAVMSALNDSDLVTTSAGFVDKGPVYSFVKKDIEGQEDIFVYKVVNKSSYAKKLYFYFDDKVFTLIVLPFGEKYIGCRVQKDKYTKPTNVTYSTIKTDIIEPDNEYTIDGVDPSILPTMSLYSSGKYLTCEIKNPFNRNVTFYWYRDGQVVSSTTITGNTTGYLSAEYGWNSQNLIDNSQISYEHPSTGEKTVRINKIPRKYNGDISFCKYDSRTNADYIVRVENKTNSMSLCIVYDMNGDYDTTHQIDEGIDEIVFKNGTYNPYNDEYFIDYYHPDKCKWMTIDMKNIPLKVWQHTSTETATNSWSKTLGTGQGTYTESFNWSTNVKVKADDMIDVKIASSSGWTPQLTVNEIKEVNGYYFINYTLTWSGGGNPSTSGKVQMTCSRYSLK